MINTQVWIAIFLGRLKLISVRIENVFGRIKMT